MAHNQLETNRAGRDFVIGDLHGEYLVLQSLLAAADFDKSKDRLISVGDLVDRGPDSLRCAELLYEPWFHAIAGNHDLMAWAYLVDSRPGAESWLLNNEWRPWCDHLDQSERASCVSAFQRLAPALEVRLQDGRLVGLVHGAVSMEDSWESILGSTPCPEKAIDNSALGRAVWSMRYAHAADQITRDPKAKAVKHVERAAFARALEVPAGLDLVVVGHASPAHAKVPTQLERVLFTDTGCGRSKGRLSMINLDTLEYLQASPGWVADGWEPIEDPKRVPSVYRSQVEHS